MLKNIAIKGLRTLRIEEVVRNAYYGILGGVIPKKVALRGIMSKFYVKSAQAADILQPLAEEAESQEWLLGAMRHDDVFWDVGANVGNWTVCCSRFVKNGNVFAFEPEPLLCRLLGKTLRANRLHNATALPIALGDRCGSADLFVGKADVSANSLSPRNDHISTAAEGISVPIFTASSIVASGEAFLPHAVKIDVEGAEYSVLRGFDQAIWESIRVMVVEIHPLLLPNFGAALEQVKHLLTCRGFLTEKVKCRSTVQLWMCRKDA